MPPKSNVPIRIGGSKSRLGCKTCKQRHVKCDEGRPTCNRCEKASRQCFYETFKPGKQQQLVSYGQAFEIMVLQPTQQTNPSLLPGLTRSVSSYGAHDILEVGAVQGYVTHIGKQLAGSFSDEVWCQIIPRVAQHEPSIWHAMIAVSRLHTGIMLGYDPYGGSSHINTAIKHYGKAIRALGLRLSSPEHTLRRDVVLLCCILLATFECLQNCIQSALKHISAGTKLLIDWQHETRARNQSAVGSYLDYTSLQPIFFVLDTQAIHMGVIGVRNHDIQDQPQIPTSFRSTEEAHISLTHISNRLTHWAYWIGACWAKFEGGAGNRPDEEWMRLERERLQLKFAEWNSAFELLRNKSRTRSAVMLLLMQRKILHIFLGKQINGPGEMGWDRFIPDFREAVECAELYMELTSGPSWMETPPVEAQSGPGDCSKPALTIAMDMVMSLFLICAKCRDSDTRWRAFRILKIRNRREGLYPSNLCAAVARRIMMMEEANAGDDGYIPESARVFDLDVRLNAENGGEVTHTRRVTQEDGSTRTELHNNTSW